MPALLKAMSNRPNFATVCLTIASTSSSFETSQRIARVLKPLSASSFAAARTSFSFTSAKATEASDSAKAFAVANPSPDAAPVTSATLPSNKMLSFSRGRFL